jgi:hypothetical protein
MIVPQRGLYSSQVQDLWQPTLPCKRSGREEFAMSAINGDKSRFHRERKQKIARRQRTRELLRQASAQPKSGNSGAGKTSKSAGE